ncbi:MAG: FtsX-like permease family protein [Gammaproteobacteria bacterium]|nr:FtsX-like permease family protein [Gammaproteobacteria bacterium]MYB39483.1 FtsX-like permease family protein [Gammaproteobacteria bacterium]
MSIVETVRVALASILANLLRSSLTMLGIIIGVAAVITMVALGTGAQRAVDAQIAQLGTRVLSVMAGQSFRRGVASANRVSLTVDDYEALVRDAPLLTEVVPELSGGRQIKFGNKNLFHDVVGTTPNFPGVHAVDVRAGTMFTAGDLATRRRVVVLGSEIPQNLEMAPESLIGRTVAINRVPFEIIGVFEEVGERFGPEPDDRLFIPLTTAELRVFGQDRLRGLSAQVVDGVSLEMGMVDIERVLRREHKIRPGEDNDFMILNRRQFMEMAQASTEIFAYLLASIAGVSLLVGGIGIMNIMLVSVTERTREIGVRKALGATRFNILMQFVVEALTIGVLGGVLGIALGGGAAWALTELVNWNVFISVDAILLAVLFSVGVGLFFGIWPARRAAQLDPIEALRHD